MAFSPDTKDTLYFDTSLMSGSDLFRTTVGEFYEIVEKTVGDQTLFTLEYNTATYHRESQYLREANATWAQRVTDTTGWTRTPYESTPDTSLVSTISEDVMVPNIRFPARMYGDPAVVKDDKMWHAVVLGGNYEGSDYGPIFSEGTFTHMAFEWAHPYTQKEAALYSQAADIVEVTYDYNYYLREYERASTGRLEKDLPNVYYYDLISGKTDTQLEGDGWSQIYNMVNLEGPVKAPDVYREILQDELPLLPAYLKYDTNTTQYIDTTTRLRQYLTGNFPGSAMMGPEILFFADENSRELINAANQADSNYNATKFPFYTKINFINKIGPLFKDYNFVDQLNASTGNPYAFIQSLQSVFGYSPTLEPGGQSFVRHQEYTSGSPNGTTSDVETIETVGLRQVELLGMLAFCYNHYENMTANGLFMNSASFGVRSAQDPLTYSYENVDPIIHLMNSTYRAIEKNDDLERLSLPTLLYKARSSVAAETIAYKICKYSGDVADIEASQKPLQEYWILNDSSKTYDFSLLDSQIKYGQTYTYKIYAYALVSGYQYNYSDLVISRKIQQKEDSTTTGYCLEFTTPGGQVAEKLFEFDTSPASYNTGSLYYGDEQYLADFNVTAAPTVKVCEIPIYSKAIKVIDHPPPRVDAEPYQVLNNSQQVGFRLNVESFVSRDAPTPITTMDAGLMEEYLHSNDLNADDDLQLPTASEVRYIEVYRLTERPTSMADFEGNLIKTIDMKIENSDVSHNITHFTQAIKTNHTYYYLFRALNEHFVPGYLSEIYQTELVDDGGYKYATFEAVLQEEAKPADLTGPSVGFRKLLQLVPNLSQLSLSTSGADLEDTASNQLQADKITVGPGTDSIWDQEFKIRLTSKKSGKKIDLNVTYVIEKEL